MTFLAALVLADPPPGVTDLDWRSFLTGSILTPVGLVIGFLSGVVAPGWILKQVSKERDAARADLAVMQKLMIDELVPLLTRNVDVLKSIDSKMEPPTIRLREPGP